MNNSFIFIQPQLHLHFYKYPYKTINTPSNMTIYDVSDYNQKYYGTLNHLQIMPSANCIWILSYNGTQDFRFLCIGSQSRPISIDISSYNNHFVVIFDINTIYSNTKINCLRPSLLRDQQIDLIPHAQSSEYKLLTTFINAASFNKHIEILLNYINQYTTCCSFPVSFQMMMDMIFTENEPILLQNISAKTRYSVRHINRMFHNYLGYGPKTLCKYIRFQKVLREMINNPHRQNSEFILNIDYSDQAHFQREFKSFMGETPKAFCNQLINIQANTLKKHNCLHQLHNL